MKKILLGGIILFMCFSCTSNDYEQAIGDWVQTDNEGIWTDMKFKLLEVLDTQDITVADSVKTLKKEIEGLNKTIVAAEKRNSLIMVAPSTYFRACDKLKSVQYLLDSLYANRDTTEVLVKLMTCKYSIVSPGMNVQQKKTEMFMLTPDMKKCIARMVKSKSK